MASSATEIRPRRKKNPLRFLYAPRVIRPLVAIAVLLVIWQIVCAGPDSNLPSPVQVFQDTKDLIFDPFFDDGGTNKGLGLQILASLTRVAIGFTGASVVGIGLGILIGTNKLVYDALDPVFQVLRTIPPLAWLPIALASFQQAEPSAIFVIFITAIWPIVINTTVGVQQIPQDYQNVSRVLRLSKVEYFFNILFPAAVPYIFTGLRIGIGLSWLAIVAAEMLIGGVGIGFFIWDAYNSSLMSEIILALIYVGIVGLLLDRFMAFLEKVVVPGEHK
ncbi:nitrate ABC transporter permease [[Limnothrix rosea] IAM M-220]|uniref:nitrate ABC transporter permease n=1 Tax=[Limnothrix rosea] IAM M-220 TaxID=454133 RepID=UPI00096165C0|nr:nitrate ABC transporter permease [[Limnothrix rosea] IAM M-220]OKH13153.1 nitrate ABC transporter, permease protein [[Limnothrix rosea] IAM M-220]